MEETRYRENIARNIITYRKRCNLTQLQLAEKLSYSDKAISKWERGEGVPDTLVMIELCEIFNVSLNDLISDKPKKEKKPYFFRNRLIIPFLSCAIAWIVAIVAFAVGGMIIREKANLWIVFIYAININFIILVVFASLWWTKIIKFLSVTGLIWSTCLSVYLSLNMYIPLEEGNNYWMVFLIGVPVELFFGFLFLLKKREQNV